MTLLEVVVVIAIALGLLAVMAPTIGALLQLEQRRAARELALVYQQLHDEAVLRNVTFRVAHHVDGNYYEIQVGDPDTLIFDDPQARADHEEDIRSKLRRMDPEEAERARREEDRFEAMALRFQQRFELPRGTRYGQVWTPQYDRPIEPSGDEEDPEDPLVAYSYLFRNGFAEPTVIQLVEVRNPDRGFTVVVEPLSGRVHLHPTLVEHRDLFLDGPTSGPRLPR